jgi:hypothetical protein
MFGKKSPNKTESEAKSVFNRLTNNSAIDAIEKGKLELKSVKSGKIYIGLYNISDNESQFPDVVNRVIKIISENGGVINTVLSTMIVIIFHQNDEEGGIIQCWNNINGEIQKSFMPIVKGMLFVKQGYVGNIGFAGFMSYGPMVQGLGDMFKKLFELQFGNFVKEWEEIK